MVNTLLFLYHAINLRKKKDKTNYLSVFFHYMFNILINIKKNPYEVKGNSFLYFIRASIFSNGYS